MEDKTNKKSESLFSFDKLNKYYLFPFLAPIFCCTTNYFIHTIYKDNEKMELHLFFTFYIDLTYLLGGLLYFISSLRTKTEETRNEAMLYRERVSSLVKYIYYDGSKKSKIKIIIILVILSFLINISTICNLYAMERTIFEKRLYFLFFIAIFSKYILKNNIFKHQFLSMSIAFIGLIILFIPVALDITKDDIFINICSFFSSIAYSLFLVLIKYLTHHYYFSPFLCLLFIGIISIIISFFAFTIYSLIKYKNFSFIIDNFDFSKVKNKTKFSLYALAGLIFGSALQVFTIYVIYYFSPILLTVTDSISPMLSWIINIIQKGFGKNPYRNSIFKGIGYLIQLIAGLIYNEIIICNFCGFNKYTKKYLQERENQELISLRVTENSTMKNNINGVSKEDIKEDNDNESSFISEADDNKSDRNNEY